MATPDGWSSAGLAAVSEFIGRGQAPAYVEERGEVFAISQKCVRNGRVTGDAARPHDAAKPVKDVAVLRAGDVCVNSTGTGTAGRVGLWSGAERGRYFVDTHVTVVRGSHERLHPKFLTEWLLSPAIQKRMTDECFSGSTNQIELNRTAFAALEMPLPPLAEQRKIAAILTSVDDTIENTEAVIAQLQVVKKAMIEELFTRGMPGRHTRFKRIDTGCVPETWGLASLDSVCEFVGRGQSPVYAAGCTGVYAVNQKCVRGGRVTPESARAHNVSKPIKASAVLRTGDICINSTGTGTAGRVGLWGGLHDAVYFVDTHVTIARTRRERVDPKFLTEWLLAPTTQRRMFDECFTGSTNQIELNRAAFGALAVPIPDIEEQRAIASVLDAIDCHAAALLDEHGILIRTKSGLASALLSGDIRVTPREPQP